MNGCQSYSPSCVYKFGGCLTRGPCNSYTRQTDCTVNINGDSCLWNPQAAKCADKNCSLAEQSTYFNTNSECESVGNCTVQATGMGCIPKAACNTYTIQEQCQTTDTGTICAWNTNVTNPICSDKSCSTASISTFKDHTHCIAYLPGCTVNMVNVNGAQTPQGCVPFKTCNEYTQQQCYLSNEKDGNNVLIPCIWNGKLCAKRSCISASNSVNTSQLCASYWPGCTVNSTNDGCIELPETCEGMTQQQCFIGSVDKSNRKCMWLDDQCVTKTCENSPKFANESDCEAHLSNCTVEQIKCKIKICADILLTTDELCKNQLSTCTSNGTYCIVRKSCSEALFEVACVTDNNGKQCQWSNGKCVNRTCTTAPSNINTESGCQQYFIPQNGSCTTKQGGGCIVKGACSNANIQAACTTDNTGAFCVWDSSISQCRLKDCQDFPGTTHNICNKIKKTCTLGLNGKCAVIGTCQTATIQGACIIGTDGPCLWISGYLNSDGRKGACFAYDSCQSLQWTSDSQCKLISSDCTTDGNSCVGITSCSETNINGGCKTGTDGQCIQTVSLKGANDKACRLYTSCDQAYYLTHDECYNANSKCTSDYQNGCIPFSSCSFYTQQGQCKYNKDGQIKDTTGAITSTGICVWDTTNNVCMDEQCKDIALTNEQECSVKLKICTTDGTTCLVKGMCNTYLTENACNNAGGTEGACFWVITTQSSTASCRTKTCVDILNGTSTLACNSVANCVSDGTNCIVKALCSSYLTKVGMSTGTDGLCFWTEATAPSTQGKCDLMTGCSSAKDIETCNQAQNRCQWNSIVKQCENHTCETYKSLVNSCTYYYTWDEKKFNVCTLKDGKCVATDASTLSQGNCYTQTAFQYSWSIQIIQMYLMWKD